MKEPNYTPLCECGVEEIVAELQVRYEKTLFAFETTHKTDPTSDTRNIFFSGGRAAAIGLAVLAKDVLCSKDDGSIPFACDDEEEEDD